jgi:prepilin-type N-terminal cleavage/methylation domain-containing protein
VITRLRAERGFTLVELLIALSVGSVVLLATFSMLDGSVVLTGRTQKRVDATERGRLAMELVTRELRSQVCPSTTTPSIVGGGASASDQYKVNFWMFTGTGAFAPERHEIAWDTNTNSITDTAYNQAGTQLRSRRLLTTVIPSATNAPIFTYYKWGATGVDMANPLPVPLSATDAAKVVLVQVSFKAQPNLNGVSPATAPPESQVFTDQAFLRTADPNDSKGPQAPLCG